MTEKIIHFLKSENCFLICTSSFILTLFTSYFITPFFNVSSEFLEYLRTIAERSALIIISVIMFSAIFLRFKQMIIDDALSGKGLAIFRIVFFGFFALGSFAFLSDFRSKIHFFNINAKELDSSFLMFDQVAYLLPVSPSVIDFIFLLFVLSAFSAFFGFYTRTSALTFTISAVILFGIPNFFSKIDHTHHAFWLSFIFAFSSSADYYSIDKYISQKKGEELNHSRSNYTISYIAIWLVLGFIYFFPGFWKIWTSGSAWVFTENIKLQFYYKWMELGNWRPIFPINEFPFLYKSGALFVVCFELFFLWMLSFKRLRIIAVICGILFHLLSFIFMKIFFPILVITYSSILLSLNERKKSVKKIEINWPDFVPISTLVILIFIFGILKKNSWPFTVYPTFDHIPPSIFYDLKYYTKDQNGVLKELNDDNAQKHYSSARFRTLEYQILVFTKNNEYEKVRNTIESYSHLLVKNLDSDSLFVYVERKDLNSINWNKSTDRNLIYSK